MAGLSLKQLLIITPLGEETKEWALNNAEKLNEEQRFRLTQICWETLSGIYQLKKKTRLEKAILEAAKAEKELTDEEVKRIKDEVATEMLEKLDEVKSKSEVREIRKKLETKPRVEE